MDHHKGMDDSEKTPADSQDKSFEELVDDGQKTFYSGMQKTGQMENGNDSKNSDTITDCKLKTKVYDCSNEISCHINIGSFKTFEEASEYARKFLEHRNKEELFASDEVSMESNKSINNSQFSPEIRKSEHLINNCTVNEPLSYSSFTPDFYDCDKKTSSLLALNEHLRYRNNEILIQGLYEDVTRQFNEILLKSGSSESSSSPECNSKKHNPSPETQKVSCYNSSLKRSRSLFRIARRRSFSRISDYYTTIFKSPELGKEMLQHPNSSCIINKESFDKQSYNFSNLDVNSATSSPICSKYIQSEIAQSLPDSPHSNTVRTTDMQISALNSSPILFRKHKSSRFLSADESDSSSDDSRGNSSTYKKKRKKRQKIHSSGTCANQAVLLKTDNVSDDACSSQSCPKKSPSHHEENESTTSVLRSFEIINSENFEAHKSFGKRFASNSKTSDLEQSDAECTRRKKLKRSASNES